MGNPRVTSRLGEYKWGYTVGFIKNDTTYQLTLGLSIVGTMACFL